MKADLSVLSPDDLLNTAMAKADDLRDVTVTEVRMGFADCVISGDPRLVVAGDHQAQSADLTMLLGFGIGHDEKCTENLTRGEKAYRFLYMATAQQTEQKATYYHAMLGHNIPVTIRRTDKRGYVWVELPSGEVRRVKAMWVS